MVDVRVLMQCIVYDDRCAVPVVVVRPAVKVRKTVDKREGRQTYKDLVEGSSRPDSSGGREGKVS